MRVTMSSMEHAYYEDQKTNRKMECSKVQSLVPSYDEEAEVEGEAGGIQDAERYPVSVCFNRQDN